MATATKPKPPAAAPIAVESWPIDRPIPYIGNARRLSDRAIATVAASLKEFGFRQPIVVDKKDVVIVGHTRLLAAQSLGLETVPVHVARNLSAAQADAYRLMDNRAADESEWREEMLGPQLARLEKQSYDLAFTGFSESEVNEYLRRMATNQLPPAKKEAGRLPNGRFNGPGDVWILGEHHLVCGAGEGRDVAALIEAWQSFTGLEAQLLGGGSYAATAAARVTPA